MWKQTRHGTKQGLINSIDFKIRAIKNTKWREIHFSPYINYCTGLMPALLCKKIEPNRTAMPVMAIGGVLEKNENSCSCLRWGTRSLSTTLVFLHTRIWTQRNFMHIIFLPAERFKDNGSVQSHKEKQLHNAWKFRRTIWDTAAPALVNNFFTQSDISAAQITMFCPVPTYFPHLQRSLTIRYEHDLYAKPTHWQGAPIDPQQAEGTHRTRKLQLLKGNFHLYARLKYHVPSFHCKEHMKLVHECLRNVPPHVFREPYHHKLYIFQDSDSSEHNAGQYWMKE